MSVGWFEQLIALCLSIAAAIATLTGPVAPSPHTSKRPTSTTVVVVPPADLTRPEWLFESDRWSSALSCANGSRKPYDHREIVCRVPTSSHLTLDTTFGPITLTAFATRSDYSADGTYGLSEDVALIDAEHRLVATLVQWEFDVHDTSTSTRRRRVRIADIDADGSDELCIESATQRGSGLFDLLEHDRFVVSSRHVGHDAFAWNGDHLARVESLDGACPTTGYRMLVTLPLSADPVHASRDR